MRRRVFRSLLAVRRLRTPQVPQSEKNFIVTPLGFVINIRANGSGNGCPVTYCKADEATDSFFE